MFKRILFALSVSLFAAAGIASTALAGVRQRVGNYPGVTVEKKTGRCHLPDGRDLPELMRQSNQLGVELVGCRISPFVGDPRQFDEAVTPLPGEMVLNKTSSGPLSSTRLDQLLLNMGINSLVVCGLTTAVCVTQTAREIVDRGFRVLVVEDACTEMSEEMHRAALFTFSYAFGRVKTTDEVGGGTAEAQTSGARRQSPAEYSSIDRVHECNGT
jgi:hypothetical protein